MGIPRWAVLEAIEMRAEGETWKTILAELKASSSEYETQELTVSKLRRAVEVFKAKED